MTNEEMIARMVEIQKISALFDWLEIEIDSQVVDCDYRQLMDGTCEYVFENPDEEGE